MRKSASFYIIAFVATAISFSCKKETFDPGRTTASKVANEWWANLYSDGQALYSNPAKILTYNVADSQDSIWVDDNSNLWGIKVEAGFNKDSLSFQVNEAPNTVYPITVTIKNGKVFPNGGHSKTGNVADSIYMQAIFSDDPSTTYEIKGTSRTNRPEDDY